MAPKPIMVYLPVSGGDQIVGTAEITEEGKILIDTHNTQAGDKLKDLMNKDLLRSVSFGYLRSVPSNDTRVDL